MGHNPLHGYLFGLGAVLIWSGFILVSRLGGISELNHYDVIALRYGTCALLLLPFWWFKQRFNLFQLKYWLIALVGGLGYALTTFQGFQLAPASHGALLLPGSMPLFIFLLAVLVGQAQFTAQKTLGVIVITSGIVALFWEQMVLIKIHESIIKGDVLFLLGAFCWGIFSVLIKRWDISPWQAVMSLAILTCILYMPAYVLFAPKNIALASIPDIATQMVYQGLFATIIQLYCFVRAVEVLGAANMGSLMGLVPVIAGIAAIFVFAEPVTPLLICGLCLVATGAWVTHSNIVANFFSVNKKLVIKGE